KITFDPRLSSSGEVIVYAAVSGTNNGLWQSTDTGRTWKLLKSGQATDVVLDPLSTAKDAFGNPIGNLQTIYVAYGNDANNNGGVWTSTNQGVNFTLLNGGGGHPQIQNADA